MTVVCSGCEIETESRLKCPKCVKLGRQEYFCGQECFTKQYKTHSELCHKAPAPTMGAESLKVYKEDDMQTWVNDARLRPFVALGCDFPGSLRPWPTTPMNVVPEHIPRPDYVETGESRLEERSRAYPIHVYCEEELTRMRASCRIAREALDLAHSMCKTGITPVEIDDAVHHFIVEHHGYPSPLNYYNFPKSCCISVNEIVCHGIPDLRPLRDGDIVNVDITVYHQGMHADLNETYAVGTVADESLKLMKCSYDAMMKAIAICKPGVAYRDIGRVIENHCKSEGFAVVRNYTGHGIGSLFHTTPTIPHYEMNKAKGLMKEGHVFTIEPMVNAGKHSNDMWPDNWTVSTLDGSRSAQFEHQILITSEGAEVLTARLPTSPPLDF
ncbi:methionine aminopeptidase [Gregarina niphandrodes]|uniref:Methionine aminopeptidase n=1 Tax=Gregarina niphandrodes TaxID=110365 RepID=A0A023B1I0_GRENI|nr:methionine aminopeptidase [Gregarina niphandrodes]EZG46956.1 methionine aminopeptidase [Gregarina niphandrodes]|eukprot:XP_011132231.1 methionine aminopeptidase [Gregarina niphandrodes]